MAYRLKVVRADVQFEAEGDKKFVLQMLTRFDKAPTLEELAAPLPARPAKGKTGRGAALPIVKGTSPGEFIRQFHFKKHTDFVLAFGYYLEKHSGLAAFSAADINNCYYEAKMESSNTSQMIIQNIRRGFMMGAKKTDKESKNARKLFTLTHTGEEHLQKALAGGSKQ
jgi:hypothetical protein